MNSCLVMAPLLVALLGNGEVQEVDPAQLLRESMDAMASLAGIRVTSRTTVTAGGRKIPLELAMESEVIPGRASAIAGTAQVRSDGFVGRIVYELRDVNGVVYSRNPMTLTWEVRARREPTPFGSAFLAATAGTLRLVNPTVVSRRRNECSFVVIRGVVEGSEPPVTATVKVEARTKKMLSLAVYGEVSAARYKGVIGEGAWKLTERSVYWFAELTKPPMIAAPDVQRAEDDPLFEHVVSDDRRVRLLYPVGWEVERLGAVREYRSPNGTVVLRVVVRETGCVETPVDVVEHLAELDPGVRWVELESRQAVVTASGLEGEFFDVRLAGEEEARSMLFSSGDVGVEVLATLVSARRNVAQLDIIAEAVMNSVKFARDGAVNRGLR